MTACAFVLMVAVALANAGAPTAAADICEDAAKVFTPPQAAVACYTGNFLAKMLGELNAGNNKTVEHVRVHLLPYLGGVATLAALRTDSPDTPTCTVCYADNATADGLTQLRNLLTPEQLASYDNLKVCYALLTNRVLAALPMSADGVWLKATPGADAEQQTLDVMRRLFADTAYGPGSCPA